MRFQVSQYYVTALLMYQAKYRFLNSPSELTILIGAQYDCTKRACVYRRCCRLFSKRTAVDIGLSYAKECHTSFHLNRLSGSNAESWRGKRQTDKETDRHTARQTGRQADRQADRQTGRKVDRQTGRQAGRHTDRHDTQTDRQENRIHRQAGRQTDKLVDRATEILCVIRSYTL